jgi:iron complex outermembrane receptor protein
VSRAPGLSIESANDAVIEYLTAFLLNGSAFASPVALAIDTAAVRDSAGSLPRTGAVVAQTFVEPRTTLPAPVVVMPPVNVDAALARAQRRAPTAFVTVLGLRPDLHALSSIDDALVEAAGVRVTQYGGMGAFSTMSLRGAPPGHVTVLLDGVPLTSAAHGVVDLAMLPVTAIEAVEVYRGPAPVSLATPTPGGAVNLVTQPGASERALRLAAGSFGTGEAQGTFGAQRGAWSLLAHGGWQGSDGDYLYEDDNGTPLEPSDDTIARRQNARFDAASVLARGGYAPGAALQAHARVEYFRRGQGVPGPGSTPALTARYAEDRTLVASDAKVSRGAEAPALEIRGSFAREHSGLRDTAGELGYGRVDTHERFDDATAAAELSSPAGWSALSLHAGGALRGESARPAAPTAGLPDPPPSHRTTNSAWASADVHGLKDRVLLHASERWDAQYETINDTRSTGAIRERSAERSLDAPQLGARVQVVDGLELKANWSRSARAPELDELFGNDGSITGNPTLVPEHGENWDAGAAWTGRWQRLRFNASWSHHASSIEDMILYERSNPRGARPINVGAAHLIGEETELRLGYAGVELSASTSWLSATDRSPIAFYHGRRLPQRAERQSYARLAWHGGGWNVASDVEYLGDTYLDRANFRLSPSRTLVGASLGRTFKGFSLLVEGRNLGDQLVEDVAGFPLPGRMLLFSIGYDLASRATPTVRRTP